MILTAELFVLQELHNHVEQGSVPEHRVAAQEHGEIALLQAVTQESAQNATQAEHQSMMAHRKVIVQHVLMMNAQMQTAMAS